MMRNNKPVWKSSFVLSLAGALFFVFGGISPVLADSQKGLTPVGKILMDILGATDGSSASYAPTKLLADCSADLEDCWKARGLNKDNVEQVQDACWKETKKCPKVCKDQYFALREAGMKGIEADDKVLFGKPSCIPGLDKAASASDKDKVKSESATLASTVAAQQLMPDLTPVVVNAERGYIEVRNVGNAVAESSQLFIVCSTLRSGKSAPCVADLHWPGYIEKWNVLSYDIPAIQPGSKYTLRLFGSGAFPSDLSDYRMQIISDARKRIVESDESNNQSSS